MRKLLLMSTIFACSSFTGVVIADETPASSSNGSAAGSAPAAPCDCPDEAEKAPQSSPPSTPPEQTSQEPAQPVGLGRNVGTVALGGLVGSLIGVALGLVVAPIGTGIQEGRLPNGDDIAISVAVSTTLIGPLGAIFGGVIADLPFEASVAGYVASALSTAAIVVPVLAVLSGQKEAGEEPNHWMLPIATVAASAGGIIFGSLASYIAIQISDSNDSEPSGTKTDPGGVKVGPTVSGSQNGFSIGVIGQF